MSQRSTQSARVCVCAWDWVVRVVGVLVRVTPIVDLMCSLIWVSFNLRIFMLCIKQRVELIGEFEWSS